MKPTKQPFFSMTADDLMSRPVHAIPEDMPLPEAARVLSQARVSGAPVVDAAGRCVGVLSASDFVRWAGRGGVANAIHYSKPATCDWEVIELEFLPKDEVRWYMTPDPVTVGRSARIADVAHTMLDADIHRVIVVDGERRPVGVVSGTDVLAAVARAADLAGRKAEPALSV